MSNITTPDESPHDSTSLAVAEEALRTAQAALDKSLETGSSADVLAAQDVLDRAQNEVEQIRASAIEADDEAYTASVSEDLAEADAEDEHPMLYANSADWVQGYLLTIWRRGPEAKWCRQWWLHAEAYSRIEALWRSWEALRYEGPLGLATWFLNYADPMMRELTSPAGTFRHCHPKTGEHSESDAWTMEPPPPGIFN